MSDDVLQELRLQTAILRAGFKKDLDALAESAASDGVSAAIVAHLREAGSMKSTALKAAVPKVVPQGTDVSKRTIGRRLADLENAGIVERSGQAANTEYRLTGLVS